MEQTKEFKVTINRGDALLMVTMSGHFCFEHLEEIQSIGRQIKNFSETKFVVIDMSEVVDVESKMIFSFAKIQKEIRDSGIHLRVCALHLKLKRKLIERGIVRENEVHDSLTGAVKSLMAKQKVERKGGGDQGNDPIAA